MPATTTAQLTVAIIGGGPAGLMAAEVISRGGIAVDVYDAMPSLGRKLLMAGKSGLNLTHAEDFDTFLTRYGSRSEVLAPMLHVFGPQALREWAAGLGVDTFVGSSGRVFPREMKAAPLLRAWLHRLRSSGVHIHVRHRWLGFDTQGCLRFAMPAGETRVHAAATVLALGGGSWAQLGSTGAWVPILHQAGIVLHPLLPANCGFDVAWSEHLRTRFAGEALKSVSLRFTDNDGVTRQQQGEFVISDDGIEGSLVYAFSAALRDAITARGTATLLLDLLPAWTLDRITEALSKPRNRRSLSQHLRRELGLTGIKMGLINELVPRASLSDPKQLAVYIKAMPIVCIRPRPIDEAISTAGGVAFEALDHRLMLKTVPGVFCAGEMLDWEAPTGGYLLTACFASGYAAGQGVLQWLTENKTGILS